MGFKSAKQSRYEKDSVILSSKEDYLKVKEIDSLISSLFKNDLERDSVEAMELLDEIDNYLKGQVQSMHIYQNCFSADRLCKQYDHVIMMSKNQSAYSPGSHLINLCANNCKLINHGIKPSGQQQIQR